MIESTETRTPARAAFGGVGIVVAAALFALAALLATAVAAQEAGASKDNPSGLPLPRFVTTRSTPINVRVGPGTRYEVAWVYLKPGVPVEIVQEFDTWRKVRDYDGAEGWIHQNLLSGKRAGLVAPWSKEPRIPLYTGSSENSGTRAILAPGFLVDISGCDGVWCAVSATDHPGQGRAGTYAGYLQQSLIWGVYQDEEFD